MGGEASKADDWVWPCWATFCCSFSDTAHTVLGALLPRVTTNLGYSKEVGALFSSPRWPRRRSKGCKAEKTWSPKSTLEAQDLG